MSSEQLLKPTDIRIGNIIQTYVGKNLGKADYVIVDINHIKHIQNGNEYGYEGLPLTEEWLMKFGFEKFNDKGDYWDYDGLRLWTTGENVFYHINSEVLVNIYTVHHLQNLYNAITCEELILNNEQNKQS